MNRHARLDALSATHASPARPDPTRAPQAELQRVREASGATDGPAGAALPSEAPRGGRRTIGGAEPGSSAEAHARVSVAVREAAQLKEQLSRAARGLTQQSEQLFRVASQRDRAVLRLVEARESLARLPVGSVHTDAYEESHRDRERARRYQTISRACKTCKPTAI